MQLTALLPITQLNTNKTKNKKLNVVCTPEQLYSIFATNEKRNVNPNYMII